MYMGKWRIALVTVAALLLGACFDDDHKPPPHSGGSGSSGIGASGGTVNGPEGTRIVVPSGALSSNTPLAITRSNTGAPPLPSAVTALGPMFAFTPHGTTFAQPVTVTVPFDPTLVTAEMTPRLYKTNATQSAWDVVPGATMDGSAMHGQVTSFSYLVVAGEPPPVPVPVVGVHRLWTMERFSRNGFELFGDVGHDDTGEAHETRVLGSARMTEDGMPADAIASIYSSPTGNTFWAEIRSPAEILTQDEVGVGGRTELQQVQWFRKLTPDATLRFKITYVSLQAMDYDPRPPRGNFTEHAQAEMSITAFDEKDGKAFFHRDGKALLIATFGGSDRFVWSETPKSLWRVSQFEHDDDVDGSGARAFARLKNSQPIYVVIPLDGIDVGESFSVATRVIVEALDLRQTESFASAFLKDPQGSGGNEIEFTGLELLPPQAHSFTIPELEPAPECTHQTRPEAGLFSLSSSAYETIETPMRGAVVLVTRTGGAEGYVSARITTSDGSAIAGEDYASVSSLVVFDDGEGGERGVFIPIAVDAVAEPDEQLQITLSEPRGCAALGDTTSATLTIVDDDRQDELPETYSVGGTVSGLVGSGLTIEEARSGVQLTPTNGAFTFDYGYPDLATYDVRVVTQPTNPIQTCTVENGGGAISATDVTNVAITCVTPAPTGSLDVSFGDGGKVTANLPGGARSVALQADGRIVVTGNRRLMRFNTNGSLDTTFGANGTVNVVFDGSTLDDTLDVAVQPDQKIVVVGHTRVGAQDDFGIARFNPDGSPDSTFSVDGWTSVPVFDDDPNGTTTAAVDRAYKVLVQPDGKILVAGHGAYRINTPTAVSTMNSFAIVRLNADGTLDPTFDGDGRASSSLGGLGAALAYAAVLQPDGKIVLGGRNGTPTADADIGLARFNADGSIDGSLGSSNGYANVDVFGRWDEIADLALDANGNILATAQVVSPAHDSRFKFTLLRFAGDGRLLGSEVTPIGPSDDNSRAIALQSDGRILIAGSASSSTVTDFGIVRHNPDGSLDTTFGTNGVVTVDFFNALDGANDVVVQPDGKILVVGVTRSGSSNILGMVRIEP